MSWGHGLTDADQHHPLQLGGQSVGFPSLPLPSEACTNLFLQYYSYDGSF